MTMNVTQHSGATGILWMICILLITGCGNNTPSCPEDRHLEGGRCVCNDGFDLNGVCIGSSQDGDSDELPTEEELEIDAIDADPDELIDGDDSDTEDTEPEAEPDPEPDPEPEPDVIDEPDSDEAVTYYSFPQPSTVFDLAVVVNLKFSSDPNRILIGASPNGTIGEIDDYNFYTTGTAGENPNLFATVSWLTGDLDWLDTAVTQDGVNMIYSNYQDGRYVLFYKNIIDNNSFMIENTNYFPGHQAVSPDGKWLAFGKGNPRQHNGLYPALFVRNLETMAETRLIAINAVAASFAFTTDSQRLIVGYSPLESNRNYIIKSTDPQGTMSQVIATEVAHPHFSLAADCDNVLYFKRQSFSETQLTLFASSLDGDVSSELATVNWQEEIFNSTDIQHSPSCSRILYAIASGNGQRTWRMTDKNGRTDTLVSEAIPEDLFLSPDGEYALRMDKKTGLLTILDIRNNHELYRTTTLLSRRPVYSTDGKHVYWAQTMPADHPQNSHSMVMGFSFDTHTASIIGDNADGVVIKPNERNGLLYYSLRNGDLATVPLSYSITYP